MNKIANNNVVDPEGESRLTYSGPRDTWLLSLNLVDQKYSQNELQLGNTLYTFHMTAHSRITGWFAGSEPNMDFSGKTGNYVQILWVEAARVAYSNKTLPPWDLAEKIHQEGCKYSILDVSWEEMSDEVQRVYYEMAKEVIDSDNFLHIED